MSKGAIIGIVIIVLVLGTITFMVMRKKKEDTNQPPNTNTPPNAPKTVVVQPTTPDMAGNQIDPTTGGALGLGGHDSGHGKCMAKCDLQHPFNKKKRQECKSGCPA